MTAKHQGMEGRSRLENSTKMRIISRRSSFQFPDAVVFHHFRGFDKYGFTTGGFVMYNAFYFPFQGWILQESPVAVAGALWAQYPYLQFFRFGHCANVVQ